MTEFRDARLKKALEHAPDEAAPPASVRAAIRAHALAQAQPAQRVAVEHEADLEAAVPAASTIGRAAAPVAKPSFWRWLLRGSGSSSGRVAMPWNAAFATVLVAGFVTLVLRYEDTQGPADLRDSLPSRSLPPPRAPAQPSVPAAAPKQEAKDSVAAPATSPLAGSVAPSPAAVPQSLREQAAPAVAQRAGPVDAKPVAPQPEETQKRAKQLAEAEADRRQAPRLTAAPPLPPEKAADMASPAPAAKSVAAPPPPAAVAAITVPPPPPAPAQRMAAPAPTYVAPPETSVAAPLAQSAPPPPATAAARVADAGQPGSPAAESRLRKESSAAGGSAFGGLVSANRASGTVGARSDHAAQPPAAPAAAVAPPQPAKLAEPFPGAAAPELVPLHVWHTVRITQGGRQWQLNRAQAAELASLLEQMTWQSARRATPAQAPDYTLELSAGQPLVQLWLTGNVLRGSNIALGFVLEASSPVQVAQLRAVLESLLRQYPPQ